MSGMGGLAQSSVQEFWRAMWLKLFIKLSSNFMTELRCRGLSNDISSLRLLIIIALCEVLIFHELIPFLSSHCLFVLTNN